MSVDESLDEYRRMYTSVDESIFFRFIPEKVTDGPILLLLESYNSRPHQYANFQFCSFVCIITSHNVVTPHISKTYLPIVSLNVR